MEESFRNTLIIISAIIIGAIFVHGLWSIRKNKNPYKLKAKPHNLADFDEQNTVTTDKKVDTSGFDQDGIGQVKVVRTPENTSTTTANAIHDSQFSENDVHDENIAFGDQSTNQTQENIGLLDSSLEPSQGRVEPTVGEDLSPELILETPDTAEQVQTVEKEKSVYSDPVSQPKPQPRKRVSKKPTKAELKRNQMEINFGDTDTIDNTESNAKHTESDPIEPEVLAISVIAPQGQIISGAALLPTLLTLGMKYGDMNIFHRHQDNAGNGKVTFSLANALNPGTFDLDNMESFVTQGVSLFMTLPNAGNAFEVFDQMLLAAKQIANEFNAQLLDDKRSVLTKQTEQHYISRIREFERKSRIAAL